MLLTLNWRVRKLLLKEKEIDEKCTIFYIAAILMGITFRLIVLRNYIFSFMLIIVKIS